MGIGVAKFGHGQRVALTLPWRIESPFHRGLRPIYVAQLHAYDNRTGAGAIAL
jgi:hypothetical protein